MTEYRRDERLAQLMAWAERTVARINALPDIDKAPAATVCQNCKDEDCLGPHIAANRGGCRMQTWADVG